MFNSDLSIEEQAKVLQDKMRHLERKGDGWPLSARLAEAHPYHPVRLARGVFGLVTILSVLFTIACLIAPVMLRGEALRYMQIFDQSSPIGLPVLGAICFAIAGGIHLTSRWIEIILARDCPLLPEEKAKYDTWKADLNSLILPVEPKNREPEVHEEPNVPEDVPEEQTKPQLRLEGWQQTPNGPPPGPLFSTLKGLPAKDGLDNSLGLNEEWLIQTLKQADDLNSRFPIQVSIAYSPEKDVPFAVMIERATLGVINEAILEFVVFLDSIPTPPKALIQLVNMEHVSQKLPLTVVTAMDAHCAATADINQIDSEIHIHFVSPDSCWKRFPFLPTHLL